MNNPVYKDDSVRTSEGEASVGTPRRSDKKQRFSKAPIKSIKASYSELQKFWKENMGLMKDHLPIPPRQGLVWDQVKHRWVRPEEAGKTVWEVSGKNRIRGVGTGAAQGSISRKKGLERYINLRRGRIAGLRRSGLRRSGLKEKR